MRQGARRGLPALLTTLYTLMPMYLESLRAGMETCRVSQARKMPNACERSRVRTSKGQA